MSNFRTMWNDLGWQRYLGPMGRLAGLAALFVCLTSRVVGQTSQVGDGDALPDAPSAAISSTAGPDKPAGNGTTQDARPLAPRYHKYIAASQRSVAFASEDKIAFGLHDAFSLASVGIWGLAGAWETIIDGSPNYPQSFTGLGQRIGAAAIRDTSETLMVDSLFAPLFREDPRYYQLGKRARFGHRLVYALSRPLITRSDSQGTVPNTALLAGDLGSIALTNAYYPQQDRGLNRTAKSFGISLGSIALGDAFQEFKLDAVDDYRAWRQERRTR